MILRTTKFKVRKEALPEVLAKFPDLKKALAQVDTMVLNYAAWNNDGEGMTMAVYNSRKEADAALEMVGGVWQALAPFMENPPEFTTFENAENMRG